MFVLVRMGKSKDFYVFFRVMKGRVFHVLDETKAR